MKTTTKADIFIINLDPKEKTTFQDSDHAVH